MNAELDHMALTSSSQSERPVGNLRIMLIGINYAPELTGIAPYTTELAAHFARQGHEVHVITGMPHYPEWRRMPVPNIGTGNPAVNRYWHHIPRRPNALGRMWYEVSWLISAARGAFSQRSDVVIGIVPSLSGGLLAVLAGRWKKIPVGVVVKDLMGPAAAQSGYSGGRAVAGFAGIAERYVLRHSDRVAVISEGFRRYVSRSGVATSRIHSVRDWTHPGEPSESIAECRRRLGWEPTEFICLHAGNMGQKQGLDNLLDAARNLSGRNIRIVLTGDGNDRERLIARSEELRLKGVVFLGLQAPGQYEAMLRAADVLLVSQRPSVADMSLPSKLASYFSAGRPVAACVSADSETAHEVLAAKAGIVVDPGTPRELAGALIRLKNDPIASSALGANGRTYAAKYLTPDCALAEYDSFLFRLVSSQIRTNGAGRPLSATVAAAPDDSDGGLP